jgi:hypothetical protein
MSFFFLYFRINMVADAAVTPNPATNGKIKENELSS